MEARARSTGAWRLHGREAFTQAFRHVREKAILWALVEAEARTALHARAAEHLQEYLRSFDLTSKERTEAERLLAREAVECGGLNIKTNVEMAIVHVDGEFADIVPPSTHEGKAEHRARVEVRWVVQREQFGDHATIEPGEADITIFFAGGAIAKRKEKARVGEPFDLEPGSYSVEVLVPRIGAQAQAQFVIAPSSMNVPKATIESPAAGATVGTSFPVRGSVQALPKGTDLWLATRREANGVLYPKVQIVLLGDSSFEENITSGGKEGPLGVCVVATDAETTLKFLGWRQQQQSAQGEWVGIPIPPWDILGCKTYMLDASKNVPFGMQTP